MGLYGIGLNSKIVDINGLNSKLVGIKGLNSKLVGINGLNSKNGCDWFKQLEWALMVSTSIIWAEFLTFI
jgi:hypothetical protein